MRSPVWIAVLSIALAAAGCATPRRHEDPGPSPAKNASGLPDGAVVTPVATQATVAPSRAAPGLRVPTILVIGDSHTYGAFGYRLHERLAAIGGHAVISEAAGGATTETYLEERPEARVGYRVRESARGERVPRARVDRLRSPMDSLDVLLARHEPEIVIVALGTNRPRAPVGESCDTFMQHLVHDWPGRRVFWIGPAAIGRAGSETVVASLRGCVQKVAGATFVDSTTFNASSPLPPGNPHFGPADARRWADVAFEQIGPRIIAD
jgi:hypothetical protein